MYFDPKQYETQYRPCMRCRTKKEYEWLCEEMEAYGYKWSSGAEYTSEVSLSRWPIYGEDMVVFFMEGSFSRSTRDSKCVLEASSFMGCDSIAESDFPVDYLMP